MLTVRTTYFTPRTIVAYMADPKPNYGAIYSLYGYMSQVMFGHIHQPRPKTPEADWLTASEAQKQYFSGKQSLRWWYRAAKDGLVPSVKIGGSVWFRRVELDKMLQAGGEPKTTPVPPTLPTPVKPVAPTNHPSVFRHFPK